MNGIAKMLKETVEKTARKQVRAETESLRKASAGYRKTIAELSLRVKGLERELASVRRRMASEPAATASADQENVRFSVKGLQSLRRKLGISKTECGMLLGVSGRTIGLWENGQARPQEEQIRAISGIRKIGKREAQARLEEIARKEE